MKCQAQWVDANGKPTPDENEAVAMGHVHKMATPMSLDPRVQPTYLDEVVKSLPVCAEHMKQVKYNWRYGSGGAWTFTDL